MHKFSRPGVFLVSVECTTSDWHVTAQKAITIQEPVRDFGDIRCYSINGSNDGAKCHAQFGQPVHIEVMVQKGK